MLVDYKMQTPFEIFTIIIEKQKGNVSKNEPDINRKAKASKIKIGSITDLDHHGIRQGILFWTAFVKQVNLLCVSLNNRDPNR